MKILITTPIFPPDIGGPARYIPELCNQLIKKNYQVSVVCFASKKPKKYPFSVSWINPSQPIFLRQSLLALNILKKIFFCNLVYVQGTLTVGLTSLILSKIFRKKVILKFVGDEIWEDFRSKNESYVSLEKYYKKNPNSLKIKLHRYILKSSNIIITPSEYLKEFLVKYHKVNRYKIEIIPNPVEIPPDIPTIKKDIGFVYAGRLVSWKNIDLIIKSIANAHYKNPYIKLTIVGEGESKKSLETLVDYLQAKEYIKFTGGLDKISTYSYIKSSDGFILMSDYEGQSHALIEAILLKTPVIASDIPANEELIGDYGYLVPIDEKLLAKKVLKVKKEFKQVNPNLIKQIHSWKFHIQCLSKYI